jgi:UDP-galactopyranose mutase
MDLALLADAATLRPEWSWVLLGPVTKIVPDALPRRPNLHYLGKREYADLPAYLKAFDAAMLPFALNQATRSISPTKTLEYLAAHKPVVSTPIRDVVSLYGSVVRIADSPGALVAAVEAALGEDAAARRAREAREQAVLAHRAWDAIVEQMQALIERALTSPRRPHVGSVAS